MPLTEFQKRIAKLLSGNRTPDSYLAGGAALHIEPNSKRFSNDLDYFHDSEERVANAFNDDRDLLVASGFQVNIVMQHPGFVRALVILGEESTKVEWAHDSAWRFMPTIESAEVGYILHPVDLAINKLLALVGRDEPRDYLDIHEAMIGILPLGALCWAAAGKDPGFTPHMLLDLLGRRGKYRPEDMDRLNLTEEPDLVDLKAKWLSALEDAQAFIERCSPKDLGCLFYSPVESAFVQPKEGQEVQRHFGRPGGVLPTIQ